MFKLEDIVILFLYIRFNKYLGCDNVRQNNNNLL